MRRRWWCPWSCACGEHVAAELCRATLARYVQPLADWSIGLAKYVNQAVELTGRLQAPSPPDYPIAVTIIGRGRAVEARWRASHVSRLGVESNTGAEVRLNGRTRPQFSRSRRLAAPLCLRTP
jgi:hypothetical protein